MKRRFLQRIGGPWWRWLLVRPAFVLLLLGGGACSEPPTSIPVSQRLVDVFQADWLEGRASESPSPSPKPVVWHFDGPPPDPPPENWPQTRGWEPITGIAGLTIREGRLSGSTSSELPVLGFRRSSGLDDEDLLQEIRVRMKISAGSLLFMHCVGRQQGQFDRAIAAGEDVLWPIVGALEPGGEMKTYVLQSPLPLRSSDIHQILIRPNNVEGARFEIESIQFVFRREYLMELPSGIGWHGLSNTYKETILVRSPESVRWPVRLPDRPLFEISLGILEEEHPVTFQVLLEEPGEPPVSLVSRTLTTPHRWEDIILDLEDFADKEVSFHLLIEAEAAGIIGLWGSPVVRDQFIRQDSRGARQDGTESEPPQGVIFILADTLRPDHLEAYGYDRATMPSLTRLAEEGILFRDTIAQGSWTKVSTASLFTSLYPNTVGVLQFADRVPSAATTLAEAYRNEGYATLGFSSVLFTGKFSNLHQGYEELYETVEFGVRKTARPHVDRLLPWLEAHRDVPFFVLLHLFDPHAPFEPRPPYNTLWADSSWHAEHKSQKEKLQPYIADPMRRAIDMPTREEMQAAKLDPDIFIERELAWYDGSIRAMDQELARVFERLEELGLAKKTLVVFTSDHGEEFHDHGLIVHGHSVYNELVQVPLLLWNPGNLPSEVTIDETVQLIDLMPTLLQISGIPAPLELQGQSLLPLMTAHSTENAASWRPRPAISQRFLAPVPTIPALPAVETTSLIYDGWKLIHNDEPRPGVPEFELYDRRSDPLEQTNAAQDHPEVVERLMGMMAAWRQKAQTDRLPSDTEVQQALSEEELKRLRALGYVQ